jgi:large subunit ribosomal protein L7/L12
MRMQSNAAVPGAAGQERVSKIVDEISRLTLLETADLVAQLKVSVSGQLGLLVQAKLKIADIAMPVAAAPAAAAAAAAEAEAEEEKPAPVVEKAVLTVKLESFEASAKAKVIREVKALLGCNLVEAKNMVEKAPTVLKENVVKDVLSACGVC